MRGKTAKSEKIRGSERDQALIRNRERSFSPPERSPLDHVLCLQRAIGNRGVGRLIQRTLNVGHPGDKYEREAGGITEAEMLVPGPGVPPRARLHRDFKMPEASGAINGGDLAISPANLNIQKGPPETEAGTFAQNQAREDLTWLNNEVVDALRATGIPIRVNTADAIRDGTLSLGVITRHPEPDRHTSDDTSSGTYFFPDTDLNTVLRSHISTGGVALVPGSPENRIYLLVRRHFSHPRRRPSFFFRTIVHEGQHYLDRHTDEVRARGIDRDVFDLWLNYETEFNAYWADGSYDFYPVTAAGITPEGPRQLRWQAIREFLMTTRPYSSRFRWLWTSTPPPAPSGRGETRRISEWRHRMHPRFHRWFEERVDGYHEPEAFNRLNSPRIDLFYGALRSRAAGRAARVRSALAALNDDDISEIRASRRLEGVIRSRLRGAILREVLSRIGFVLSTESSD